MICKLIAIATALLLAACGGGSVDAKPPPLDTAAPAQWSAIATQAVANDAAFAPAGLPPMVESSIFAMAFSAAHVALNAIDRRYKPYLTDTSAPTADPGAAVATAMHDVLKATLPSQAAYLDGKYTTTLAAVAAGDARIAGVALG